MPRSPANYLATLCKAAAIDRARLPRFDTGLTDYATANPVHADDLYSAAAKLKAHFDKPKPARPFNSLILGPPGSGKTFLAKQFRKVTGAQLASFNLSQYERPADLKACFDQVGDLLEKHDKVIGFLDEFDVRIGGVSAVQFLLQPMYDGEDNKGRKLARAAFIFSGSYLKDRQVFDSLGRGGEGIDFISFLYDWYAHFSGPKGAATVLKDFLDVTLQYHPIRQQSPATNALSYVRGLEKISDFVSRINGFVVELPDLSAPLDATRERLAIELEGTQATPDPSLASQLTELVNGLRYKSDSERFLDYRDPVQPILEYKNLILLDRLQRVIFMLTEAFAAPVKLSRSLLNYLTTVPLIHGMRSLNTAIEALTPHVGTVTLEAGARELLRRHIADQHAFARPDTLWELVQKSNSHFANQPGDMIMSVR